VGFTQIKRAKHTRAAECRSTFFYPGLRLRDEGRRAAFGKRPTPTAVGT
jgi:hypothetical protein